MLYFALSCFLLHGPVPAALAPPEVTAERLFALLAQTAELPVRRAEPDLDLVPVSFQEGTEPRSARVLILVLRAHGIYVHPVETAGGEGELHASRSPKPPVRPPAFCVRVYAPRHALPEELIEALKDTPEGRAVQSILEPRTGKILFKAEAPDAVARAIAAVRKLDQPLGAGRICHLYRCDGMFALDAHAALLRLLSSEVRNRVVVLPYPQVNTLMVGCGTDDWRTILSMLKKINPAGEVVDRPAGKD